MSPASSLLYKLDSLLHHRQGRLSYTASDREATSSNPSMEATGTRLTRSASLSPRLRRSCAAFCVSPRSMHQPQSSSSLRRATSDADIGRAAPATTSPPLPLLRDLVDGGGRGKGRNDNTSGSGRGGGGGGGGQQHMGEYYRRVLRVEPENPLLLRNYGRYLQEVEGDLGGAEECYARALLATPDDGDLLSLYGQVLWEARQDKERAAAYLERAVQAAPDDCYVLGSYASFLWDAEEDAQEQAAGASYGSPSSPPPLGFAA